MKTVLITGARGFVGSALVQYFIEYTDYTIYYTKRPPKDDDRLNKIDLKDRVHVWEQQGIDIILHAAGNASSLKCIEDPESAIRDNILETFKVLEIARKHDIEHLIYFSSVEVYGNNGTCLEESSRESKNMYAATKCAGEEMCRAYHSSYGVPCSIVRVNNTFGKMCQEERFPVLVIKKLLNKEPIFLHSINGEIVGRRWLSIHDVTDMVYFILNQPPGRVYNTTGDYITNLDLVNYISKAMNIQNVSYRVIEENIPGRMGNQDAPPDFIRSLGWVPKYTFEERIQEFVDYFQPSFFLDGTGTNISSSK